MKITKVTEDAVATLLDDLLKRSPNNYTGYADKVQAIIDDVRERGDEALFEMTKRFDGADLNADNIRVTQAEIDEAYTLVDASLIEVIRKAMTNIRVYHEKQRQYGWFDTTPDGTILGQKVTPLQSTGVYVPGGKAAYPSSVLMNVIPAKVAGVRRLSW